ncbi:DUF1707 SHOCT-like domain-containing protein [Tenggerimyces flavus]|uniref:DUF1707 domain-containing protein n=1 Tax=Tenggerimyces flavus TaxID=1708749 RepID=A0ABV7YC26_9ACTN|nr:DUF1707 domain-containing protein [Tenggerimyces flavus]MBM7787207.1 hypothetical protein [Tenggerimyces flavus]
MRAGDADREFAMGLLRRGSADGQLSAEEFDRRLRLAVSAKTVGELAGLVDDLQGLHQPPPFVPPQQPYAYAHVPGQNAFPPPPRKKNTGVVAAIVAICAVVMLGGVTAVAFFATDSDWTEDLRTEPGECAGPPEEVFLMDCLPEDNPLTWTDLSTARVEQLERLGLPGSLPILAEADFDDQAWQSASASKGATTFAWHLEYLLGEVEDAWEELEPEHVLAAYRATADPGRFGTAPVEVKRPDGAIGLRWTAASDLTVWVSTEPDGDVRVELDVRTEVRPAAARPDVLGPHAAELRQQAVAKVPGMTYLRSNVSQAADRLDTCLVAQVWSATPAQFAAVRGKVGQGVTATHQGGELTFTSMVRCAAFNL